MSLEETRLSLAVKVASHCFRNTKGTDTATRTAAFREAYHAIADLKTDTEDWAVQTLEAAWELVRDAYPNGGSVAAIIADLVAAQRAIAATAQPAGGSKRKKPKRDA